MILKLKNSILLAKHSTITVTIIQILMSKQSWHLRGFVGTCLILPGPFMAELNCLALPIRCFLFNVFWMAVVGRMPTLYLGSDEQGDLPVFSPSNIFGMARSTISQSLTIFIELMCFWLWGFPDYWVWTWPLLRENGTLFISVPSMSFALGMAASDKADASTTSGGEFGGY